MLVLHADGSIGFNCFHAKHKDTTWGDIQERFGEEFQADVFRVYFDPERLADKFLSKTQQDGVPALFTDGKATYRYDNRWLESTALSNQCEIRPIVVDEFLEFAAKNQKSPKHVTTGIITNTCQAILSKVHKAIPPEQHPPYWLGEHDWNATDVLPVANGIINLRKYCVGEEFFLPPTARLFTQSVSQVEFLPHKGCPEFQRFLESLEREPEWYNLLQQGFGYTLWLGYHLQKFFVMVGPGGSGKGLLMSILRALVADSHAAVNLSNLSESDDAFGLETCPGKKLITIPEARMPSRNAAQIVDVFKAITGGDPVRINPKNKTPYTCPIVGTPWISANKHNIMPDPSNAINRRMIPLQFTKSFSGLNGNPQPDLKLPDKLAAEYPGILLWALEGAKKLFENGGVFTLPESSEAMLQESIHQSSPLQEFLTEKCEIEPNCCVRTVSAYKTYRDWAGVPHLSESDFVAELITAAGYQIEKARMGSATSKEVKGRSLQATRFDSTGRAHVFLNFKLI